MGHSPGFSVVSWNQSFVFIGVHMQMQEISSDVITTLVTNSIKNAVCVNTFLVFKNFILRGPPWRRLCYSRISCGDPFGLLLSLRSSTSFSLNPSHPIKRIEQFIFFSPLSPRHDVHDRRRR
jgi:hypothetical protein